MNDLDEQAILMELTRWPHPLTVGDLAEIVFGNKTTRKNARHRVCQTVERLVARGLVSVNGRVFLTAPDTEVSLTDAGRKAAP